MRLRAKVDKNHGEIVKALRDLGCSVQSLAQLGKGVPDLLVARNGVMWLMEVKDGKKPPSGRKLTEDEKNWAARWKAMVHVVASPEEALSVINRVNEPAWLKRVLAEAKATKQTWPEWAKQSSQAEIIGNLNKTNGHRPECVCAKCVEIL